MAWRTEREYEYELKASVRPSSEVYGTVARDDELKCYAEQVTEELYDMDKDELTSRWYGDDEYEADIKDSVKFELHDKGYTKQEVIMVLNILEHDLFN